MKARKQRKPRRTREQIRHEVQCKRLAKGLARLAGKGWKPAVGARDMAPIALAISPCGQIILRHGVRGVLKPVHQGFTAEFDLHTAHASTPEEAVRTVVARVSGYAMERELMLRKVDRWLANCEGEDTATRRKGSRRAR